MKRKVVTFLSFLTCDLCTEDAALGVQVHVPEVGNAIVLCNRCLAYLARQDAKIQTAADIAIIAAKRRRRRRSETPDRRTAGRVP